MAMRVSKMWIAVLWLFAKDVLSRRIIERGRTARAESGMFCHPLAAKSASRGRDRAGPSIEKR